MEDWSWTIYRGFVASIPIYPDYGRRGGENRKRSQSPTTPQAVGNQP